MKRILIILSVIVILGLLYFIKPEKTAMPGVGPGKGAKAPSAVTYIVVKDTLFSRSIKVTGNLAPQDMVRIAPEIGGRIRTLSFREGASIGKGAIIAKLDDSELQAQLLKFKALLTLAETNTKREQSLLLGGGTSQELYDRAENSVITILADIAVIKAAIAKTEIRAPFSGIIGIKQISEGSYVSPGTVITELVNVKPIRIECAVPERYAKSMNKGMNITFVESGDSEQHVASIYAINPIIDNATRTIGIIAHHKNGQAQFKPGGFVEVTLPLTTTESTILIPTEAAVPDIRGLRVFILQKGKAIPRPIITGMRTDTSLEIVKGLSIGDTLIVSGASLLKPKSPVKAQPHWM